MVVRSEGHNTLPNSCKTLLGISNFKTDVQLMLSAKNTYGFYKYFGIQQNSQTIIHPLKYTESHITLLFHVDGLEIYRNSKKGLWTILGKVYSLKYQSKPFLIGIYNGHSKPKYASEFLSDLVSEINDLKSKGVDIRDFHFDVYILGFTCDMPARAFIKRCKGHSGYYSCERCEIKGINIIKNKRVFPFVECPLRNCTSFKTKSQPQHHLEQEDSPLIDINDFDPVSAVFLDSMQIDTTMFFKKKFCKYTNRISKNNIRLIRLETLESHSL